MVKRRSTVRFRKGALVVMKIRTIEHGLGAIPGAKVMPGVERTDREPRVLAH
jgi:hypothetical protein